MPNTQSKKQWEVYRKQELATVSPILKKLGFVLEDVQPHTIGERFLMQAVTTTSGKKLILIGKRTSDNSRVVIKISSTTSGKQELLDERKSTATLKRIDFAAHTFFSPKEIYFGTQGRYLISIHEYIEQKSTFLARSLQEQFTFALRAFKAQEGAHATTHSHHKAMRKSFGILSSHDYIHNFEESVKTVSNRGGTDCTISLLERALHFLKENTETIEQYCGFLVHTDFVPHNFRINNKKMYLLDHSSIRFGNKYEGWARFLNFMTLYNRDLEKALTDYVHNNRTEEEHLSLTLMRAYRLGELIAYYTSTIENSEGKLQELNLLRIELWKNVLRALLDNKKLEEKIVKNYIEKRDALRSDDEKLRQKDLH